MAIIRTKLGLGRKVLTDYLLETFIGLEPSQAQLGLSSFKWVAIYTTNYDDLSNRLTKIME